MKRIARTTMPRAARVVVSTAVLLVALPAFPQCGFFMGPLLAIAPHVQLADVYTMSDAAGDQAFAVPYFQLGTIISLRNQGSTTANLIVIYTDLDGTERSPAANTFDLDAGAVVRWSPLVSDVSLEGDRGVLIPDMEGGGTEGSALIVLPGGGAIVGSVQQTFPGAAGGGFTLRSFREGVDTAFIPYLNVQSTVSIRNIDTLYPIDLMLEYRPATNPGAAPFFAMRTIPISGVERWSPFIDEPGLTGTEWSLSVTTSADAGAMSEVPIQVEVGGAGGPTTYSYRAPDQTSRIRIPYVSAGAVISVFAAPPTTSTDISVGYYDLDGTFLLSENTQITDVGVMRWSPIGTVAGLTPTEVSVDITANGPIYGTLEIDSGNAARRAMMLGGPEAGSLVAPFVPGGGVVSALNVGSTTANVTAQLYDLDGNVLLGSNLAVSPGATLRWDPYEIDPALAGRNGAILLTSDGVLLGMIQLNSPTGSGGGGCFIATAAYGTPLSAKIDSLRALRDARLLTNRPGAVLADTYYRLSPPMAAYISEHRAARQVARKALDTALGTSSAPTVLFGVSALACVFVIALVRRRRDSTA